MEVQGVFDFVFRGGMSVEDGKPRWPHVIDFHISRRDALNLAITLMREYQDSENSNDTVVIGMTGVLTRDAEQDHGNEIQSR